MGNANQKKKKLQAENIIPVSPKSSKDNLKEFWLFGRPDKLNTAGPKGVEEQKRLSVHYTASQHYQENVFIEGSRPHYLEELHCEAQEGLKIMQEEHRNGVSFPDDESTASMNTQQPEQDIGSKDKDVCPESRSPTGNTDTSDCTAGSTHPGLTRQGSTFKPLNPVKSIDRNKKRSRRTTIMGIPSQVQKELALRRHSTFQQLPENPKTRDSQSGVVIIPTVDGGTPVANKEGARVHLSELEQVSREEKLLQKHLQAFYQEEQHFTFQGFGLDTGPGSVLRPKSVALPGMTSSLSSPSAMLSYLQEPQGPVMSISPQATYMSTIIPNAVLPASVDVIEIDHGLRRTRGSSIRTVSKSSLGSGDSPVSPSSSRRSDVDNSKTDGPHNNSALISSSASNLNECQSSKTIALISSPSSSKRSTCSGYSQRLSVSGRGNHHEHTGDDLISLHSSVSIVSSPISTSEDLVSGQGSEMDTSLAVDDKKMKRRSLSVTKTKLPPAPPQRTNSLHSSKIKNPSDVFGLCKETVPETEDVALITTNLKTSITLPTPNLIMENGGTPPKSEASFANRDKIERTISPSSGYSSQSGTPTLSPKEFSPTSPEKLKKLPVKPERSASRSSSSPSSSLTSLSSGASETVSQEALSKDSAISSTLAMEIKGLLNIPSHPKVRAPCPPPPDIWAQNRRSVELICTSYGSICQENQTTQSEEDALKQAGTQTEENELLKEGNDEVHSSENREQVVEAEIYAASGEEKLIIEESFGEMTNVQSKELPVVTVTLTEEPLFREPLKEVTHTSCNGAVEVHENPTDSKQNGLVAVDTLTIDVPKYPKESPPPTPPPAYQPTPPLSRKPLPTASSIPNVELRRVPEESHVLEACWPPPPPPLEESYEGGEETDFPLPPPPPLDNVIEMPDKINLTNVPDHEIQEKNPDALQQHVLNQNIALKKDITESENLANDVNDKQASSLPISSKLDGRKVEDPTSMHAHQTIENTSAVNFRRQPSTATRSKEFQAHRKSVPTPKEDANIPLVTPSLLQMVRLRSVSMAEEEGNAPTEEKSANVETLSQESCPSTTQTPQTTPQKPLRKSLSVKSTSQKPPATVTQPSLRLQEAIRMKTAAMSTRDSGLLARPVARLPPYNSLCEPGSDTYKSPASTASFIFSRSNKKVVIDTVGHAPEAQMNLKQNLTAELMQVSEQSKSRVFSNGGIKAVPPPVARKPSHGSVSPAQALPGKMEAGIKHQIPPLETKTTRVTADTIETLF